MMGNSYIFDYLLLTWSSIVVYWCIMHFLKVKVHFPPLNYHKSLIFILQLQNRITRAIQFLKLGKYGALSGFKGDFYFVKNENIQV